jgi:hypothetical protein
VDPHPDQHRSEGFLLKPETDPEPAPEREFILNLYKSMKKCKLDNFYHYTCCVKVIKIGSGEQKRGIQIKPKFYFVLRPAPRVFSWDSNMMIPAGGMLTAVHSAVLVQESVSVNSTNP